MKKYFKLFIVGLFFFIYSFAAVSGPYLSEKLATNEASSQQFYLTELSKLAFPQSTTKEGYSGVYAFVLSHLGKILLPTALIYSYLNQLDDVLTIVLFYRFQNLPIQFQSFDIIYPFHTFW